jgi:hypothetical protein
LDRLNRALSEIERLKNGAGQISARHKESLDVANKTNQDLLLQCKRLQKQKAELLGGFKKQCQLIEILKRQKVILKNFNV